MHRTRLRGADCRGRNLLLAVSIAVTALMVGCDNNGRVSLDEFLQMSAEMAQAVPPPAEGPTLPVERLNQMLGPYRVAPGDVLSVTMTTTDGTVQTPVRARVDRDGGLRLPLVGALSVKGMTLGEAEEAIYKAYVPTYQRDATVYAELVTAERAQVLVTGAVENPGLVPLRSNERNLLSAIVAAGGVSGTSSGVATLRRLRGPQEPMTVQLVSPEGIQEALAMPPLEDGDIVEVLAATPNVLFVGGLVYSSAPQYYAPGVRVGVLQALAAAGGLRMDVFPREATLTRRMANGEDVRVKLDLNRLAKGEDPNIDLLPGDILWVPHTLDTRFEEWFMQNIYFRGGVNASVNGSYMLYSSDLRGDAKNDNQNTIIVGP